MLQMRQRQEPVMAMEQTQGCEDCFWYGGQVGPYAARCLNPESSFYTFPVWPQNKDRKCFISNDEMHEEIEARR